MKIDPAQTVMLPIHAGRPPRLDYTFVSGAQVSISTGFHRQLSTSVTKVRSVNLDKWTPLMLDVYLHMNNQKGNSYWEHSLPSNFHKPTESCPDSELHTFITNKYIKKKYADSSREDPVSEYLRGN